MAARLRGLATFHDGQIKLVVQEGAIGLLASRAPLVVAIALPGVFGSQAGDQPSRRGRRRLARSSTSRRRTAISFSTSDLASGVSMGKWRLPGVVT